MAKNWKAPWRRTGTRADIFASPDAQARSNTTNADVLRYFLCHGGGDRLPGALSFS